MKDKKKLKENKGIISKLKGLFGIDVTTKNNTRQAIIKRPNKDGKLKPIKLDTQLQKYYDYWATNCHDDRSTFEDRIQRYKDAEYMEKNNTIINMAVELYCDEFTQADSQNQIITCNAKSKEVQDYIQSLLSEWGYDNASRIRDIPRHFCLYGDYFEANSSNGKEGFTSVNPVDPFVVEKRLEFNLNEIISGQEKENMNKFRSANKNIDMIYKALEGKDGEKIDVGNLFESYLFGFILQGGIALSPWNITHYRMNGENTEFFPYGRPTFINLIAPYRMLEESKTLMALTRVAKFPIELMKVKGDENMTQSELFEALSDAMEQFNNYVESGTPKDGNSIGKRIWTLDNLMDVELLENRMNTDSIKDIEMLRDDVIMGTSIPKGSLLVDKSSFGTSGTALIQQYKPFGRKVYSMQSTFLRGLIEKTKLHLVMTGKFDQENTQFELVMNFPVIEDSSDRLRMKSDTLRLANDVVSNIQSALGMRDGLPPEVIISIFNELSFLSPDEIEYWIKTTVEANAMNESGRKYINRNLSESDNKKVRKIFHENGSDTIRHAYFNAKRSKKFHEGTQNLKHFVYSGIPVKKQDKLIYEVYRQFGNSKVLKG